MRVRLGRRGADEATVTLLAHVTFPAGPLRMRYATRTGALLRIDGIVRGAFDGMHETIDLPPLPGEHEVVLEVERRSLPVANLPAGDGVRWRWMLLRAAQRPSEHIEIAAREETPRGEKIDVPLVGHAHLDVAWLWTYDATRRKALRTFATALREMELDARYVYAQSQPQEYAWVFAADRDVADRIRARTQHGWDASVAALWVEPDLHAPSGESVLRQFAHGIRWMREHTGVEPTVAWLPDTFGFPSTFPILAAHAGVPYFATTKLQWNETTRWPYPRFRWTGDDGSALIAAVIDSYDGDLNDQRLERARERDELLVVGYGDGGGGPTDAQLARVGDGSRGWVPVGEWFRDVVARDPLPQYSGELYLETHRGTYTTHHGIKARNAELERALAQAEELAAWCVAVRAPETVRRSLADDLRNAWRIVLRAQFHDVITGTAIGAVYTDVHAEYDRALAIAARVRDAAVSVLPRSDLRVAAPPPVAPQRAEDGGWTFRNAYVRAHVRDDGTITQLSGADGPNLVALANGIAAYADTPKKWDAWNLDASYQRKAVKVKPNGADVENGALLVRMAVGKATALTMRVALLEDEPWLRVEVGGELARRPRAAARGAPRRAARARRALRPAARNAAAHGVSADRRRACEVRSSRPALGARDRRRARLGGLHAGPVRLERCRPRKRGRAPGHLAAALAALARSDGRPRRAAALVRVRADVGRDGRRARARLGDLRGRRSRAAVHLRGSRGADRRDVSRGRRQRRDPARARVRRRAPPRRRALRRPDARGCAGRRRGTRRRRRRRDRGGRPRVRLGRVRAALVHRPVLTVRAIDTVLFDLDDTLHDDTAAYRAAAFSVADELARERGFDAAALAGAYEDEATSFWSGLTAEHLSTAIGDTRERMWHAALRKIGIDDTALARRAADGYVAARAGVLALLPGALDLLVALRARGCKLGLVTNGFAATHHEKIDRLGLRERMDAFFIADEIGMIKPDPALFRHACDVLGSVPERTAMVGDRYARDVLGAHEAGLFTVLVDVHAIPIPRGGPQPDAVVGSIADVLGVLPLRS